MIAMAGVSVTLGRHSILDDVSVDVGRGEWLCIVGPNGAGKSTLLRHLAGLVRGTGSVTLAGEPVERLSRRQRARLVALVPQSPTIPEGIRVLEYVLLGRSPHIHPLGIEGSHDHDAAEDALAQLDLLDLRNRVVTTLSGGERQRVLLARALAQGASIVLLDEPTTALDVGHQQQVLELIEQLRRGHGLTVVSTMHDLTLAGQYADRLVLLDHGRIAVEGDAATVLTETTIARYYGARVRVVLDGGRPAVLPLRQHGPL